MAARRESTSILQRKQERERRIFLAFAETVGYAVNLRSLRSGRGDRAPDIYCKLASGERVAFELVEILDKVFAKKFSDTGTLKVELDEALENSPPLSKDRFNDAFSDALIGIDFRTDVSLKRRQRAIGAILSYLIGLGPHAEGNFVPEDDAIRDVLRLVRIIRGGFRGPVFAPVASGALGDPVRVRIEGKFRKVYATKLPVELVAYYDLQTQPIPGALVHEVSHFIANNMGSSPFRRVWVFSRSSHEILYVYPPH